MSIFICVLTLLVGAICCDVPTSQGYEPQHTQFPKSAETRLCLEEALAKNIMFSHLESDQLSQIFAVMTETKLKTGDIVFRQGVIVNLLLGIHCLTFILGDEADKFYVLEKGECDVFAIKSGVSQHVATYDEGSAFGELALVADAPRTSTVKVYHSYKFYPFIRLLSINSYLLYSPPHTNGNIRQRQMA